MDDSGEDPAPNRPRPLDVSEEKGASSARRRLLLLGVAASLLAAGLFVAARHLFPTELITPGSPPSGSEQAPSRIISLSPAVTDTLVFLGARSQLVAISQFCEDEGLPRVGTAITPNFEKIARLAPELIVTTSVVGGHQQELSRIARTVDLPWYSLDDVIESTRALGRLAHLGPAADQLAAQLEQTLSPSAPADAPRVLLLLGSFQDAQLYYVHPASLHGSLLSSCGFRNAIESPPSGPPRLGVERLLRLDPDGVVFFESRAASETSDAELLEPLTRLRPLSAVKSGRMGVFRRPGLHGMGPGVLDHQTALCGMLDDLFAHTPPAQVGQP